MDPKAMAGEGLDLLRHHDEAVYRVDPGGRGYRQVPGSNPGGRTIFLGIDYSVLPGM